MTRNDIASSRLMVPSSTPLIRWQSATTRRSHRTRPVRPPASPSSSEQANHRLLIASQASRGTTGRATRRFSRAAETTARIEDGFFSLWSRNSMTSSSAAAAASPLAPNE